MTTTHNDKIRKAIISALPAETSPHGVIPTRKDVYAPTSHTKALRLECNLVIGARGVGKSFWSAALRSQDIRDMLGSSVSDISTTEVSTGFGEGEDLDSYPNGDVFGNLLEREFSAYDVWRAVLARWAGKILSIAVVGDDWAGTSEWVANEPEAFGRLLQRANAKLETEGRTGLIVFDALDRSSADWQTMDKIVRDLLRIVLVLKRFSKLHGKVFLREDQFENRQIVDFPDASKLLSNRVDLTWTMNDLHGLLWQRFINSPSPGGDSLRDIYEGVSGSYPIRNDERTQRSLFKAIAGEWMGKDKRRGVPYTWSVGHLADGGGRTSPRSFLAAIRVAAEDSLERHTDHNYPLHYESIKRGVQKASSIRVAELAEDYPWVKRVMVPLKGITVPCPSKRIEQYWAQALGRNPALADPNYLPPEHIKDGWSGIRQDLANLGIFEFMRDGKVNMPDLYRVAFGLGRKGGVKPVHRTSME